MSQHKHLYNTRRWKAMRAYQLQEHPLCRMHLALGELVPATVADHVQPHRGDEHLFFQGDLQSLCKHCHDAHKQAQEHSPDGILRGAGVDGTPLDLAHPWHRADGDRGSNPSASFGEDRLVTSVRKPAKLEGGA